MKLKMKRDIPKQMVLPEDFVYDFARAKKSVEANMINKHSEDTIVEEKYDGSRYGAVITEDGVKMISRNGIDRAKNVPYLTKVLSEVFPAGTIVDGEVVHVKAPRDKRWEMSRSVMGTNGYNPDIEPAQYIIYDIQFLEGKNLRQESLLERRRKLQKVIGLINEQFVTEETVLATSTLCLPRQFGLNYGLQLYQKITLDNGEGIMLKSPKEQYAKSWTKVKKIFTIDCFVTGIVKGKGKYEGQVGSLIISVMENGIPVEVGKTSGMTDSERTMFTQMALDKKLIHLVVEVKGNEVTKNLKIRHPRYMRQNPDKPWTDCSMDQLREQLK